MSSLTVEGIEEVCRTSDSSANGAYRHVWFVGDDVVVKRDRACGDVNRSEYQNFLELKPREGVYSVPEPLYPIHYKGERRLRIGPVNQRSYNIKFPDMHMVGEYLVAERVKFPHVCAEYREKHGYRCGTCDECAVGRDISSIMYAEFRVSDMHGGNFCYDKETRTAYIVDIQRW